MANVSARPTHPRRLLMVAYVFPPFFSVGGSIRVVKFLKYLPDLGWQPDVLTIDDSIEYDSQRKLGSASLLEDLPASVRIFRTSTGEPSAQLIAKGRAARRQSRIKGLVVDVLSAVRRWAGRYLLLPDTHITWLPHALRTGRRVVRERGIDVLFATCPPHSVALIGAALKALTHKPLVLDYRDDWIDTPWFHSKPALVQGVERLLERWAVHTADRVVLVTPWSRRAFLVRYPRERQDKFVLIPNGCDLEDYAGLTESAAAPAPEPGTPRFRVVHAGLLSESANWRRSPEPFFQAVAALRRSHPEIVADMAITFTGHLPEADHEMVARLGMGDMVEEVGHLPREEFLRLMASSDLLLAINYEDWSTIIPGKIYDYWAVAGPPVLLLSCPGAAQELVEENRLGLTVSPRDVPAIQEALLQVYRRKEAGQPMRISRNGIAAFDRQALAARLAHTLTDLRGEQAPQPEPTAAPVHERGGSR
ncbi:MAG: glycosyltransferase [Anaerolineae bacterium]